MKQRRASLGTDEGPLPPNQANPTRSRWYNIADLDSFFVRVYNYHQNHGFLCMLLQEIFELNQFGFVVFLFTYLVHGVNYDKLFNRGTAKTTMNEVVLSFGEFLGNFTLLTWYFMIIAFAVFALKFVRGIYQIIQFWDIKMFYNNALDIRDKDLDSTTWNEIQWKIKEAQLEHQMCIEKKEITELDIYHRILRQKNYIIALVNKRLLPPRFYLPIVGEELFWTKTLNYNIQWLLYWSPWSPFENLSILRDEYRNVDMREELAYQLGRHILYLAVVNLVFAPIIFFWQVLYYFFYYADLFRRDPGKVGLRNWSMFGLLYLRHFNELDHEVQDRLVKAHKAACKYIAAFSSPLSILIAQHIGFCCGSLMAVFVGLTVYDEDVLSVEHVITLISCMGVVVACCRAVQPDETSAYIPESLLSAVVIHTHYLPSDWQGHAHTSRIRRQFQQLFQYRVVALLEELMSPLLNPIILWRCIHPKSLEIIDFLRNFTVTVVGVGDVCSFAQMDIKKHGNSEWQSSDYSLPENPDSQAEDGKVELSLVHFKMANPTWEPPGEAVEFISNVQQNDSEGSMTNVHFNLDPQERMISSMNQSVMYLHNVNSTKRNRSSLEAEAAIAHQQDAQ